MQLPLGMRLTLRPFLLLLRDLVLLCRKRWGQITHRLWYIFGFLRSRFLSRCSERKDEIRPSAERRSAKSSPTTVICASRLPPPLTLVTGGDTPLANESPTIPVAVQGPTIDDTRQECHENDSADRSDVDNYMLSEIKPVSRSSDSVRHHDEPDPIEDVLSQNREDSTQNCPATISPSNSRPPSRSHRPASLHAEHRLGYRTGSQHSHRPPSESAYYSPPYLSDREAAASGSVFVPPHLGPPSSTQSTRPASIVHQTTGSIPASIVHQTTGSIDSDRTAPPEGRLRPMIQIERYEKHRVGKLRRTIRKLVLPPVTTEFAP